MKVLRSRATTTPTLGSVAREVGVDLSLVSRVLSGDGAARVSSDTRASIVAAAQRQGYRPNRIARSLRTGRSSILGMLTPDITNPFHSMLFRGVEMAARAAGYDTLLGDTGDCPARLRAVVNTLAEGHVEGLLVATATAQDDTIDWLRTVGLPFHLINRRRNSESDPWVGPDDFHTGWLGAEHLVALGHRRIGFLVGDTTVWNHRQRLAGFRAALQSSGIPEGSFSVYAGPATRAAGRDHTAALLLQPMRPTALFAPQTLLCEGAMAAIRQAGLRVPHDISVVGYTAGAEADVTSIAAPVAAVGKAAAERLIATLAGEDYGPVQLTLPVTLLEAGTTARTYSRDQNENGN